MFRTRLAAVVLSGGLMFVSGCLQLPQGPGLFARRCCPTDPCCSCTPAYGDCCRVSGPALPSSCGCSNSLGGMAAYPTIPQDGQIIIPPATTYQPLPKVTTIPNSPMVPYGQ